MVNYEIVYTFIVATTLLACSPGPDNIFVLTQSVAYGKKSGFAIIAGLMSGCLLHTTFVAFGFSVIIQQNDFLFFALKLFGALYLFFLAHKVFKSKAILELTEHKGPKKGSVQLYKQGFIMSVLNPKVSLFFLAFFPSFLFSTTMSSIVQFYVLGILFILISFVVFGMIAVLAGMITRHLRDTPLVTKVLKWGQIIVFVSIGVFILFSDK